MDTSGRRTLTWVVGSTGLGCFACSIIYTPSSSYCCKRDHSHSPLSQNWPAKTTFWVFFGSQHYITDFCLTGYHDNIFAWLGNILYGHELRKAVLWLLSFGSQYLWRHLYGNAAQLVLDVVLQTDTRVTVVLQSAQLLQKKNKKIFLAGNSHKWKHLINCVYVMS